MLQASESETFKGTKMQSQEEVVLTRSQLAELFLANGFNYYSYSEPTGSAAQGTAAESSFN